MRFVLNSISLRTYHRNSIINNKLENAVLVASKKSYTTVSRNALSKCHPKLYTGKTDLKPQVRCCKTRKSFTTTPVLNESGGNKSLDDIQVIGEKISLLSNASHNSKGVVEKEIQRILSPESRKELKTLKESLQSKLHKNSPESKTVNTSKIVKEPSGRDLRLHMLNLGVPFIGFGFMDNVILIWAGDQIDMTLGVTLGISTMCAAAIGNIVSDVAGVACGTIIEDFCTKLRLPVAKLTEAQRQLRSVRFAGQFGMAVGLTIGCILGMCPLLFMDPEKAERLKQEAHKEETVNEMVDEAKSIIGAEQSYLYFVVETPTSIHVPHSSKKEGTTTKYLYIKEKENDISSNKKSHHYPLAGKKGIIQNAVTTRQIQNIPDVQDEAYYCYENDILLRNIESKDVKNMICVPVVNVDEDVIAVIQVVNKSKEDESDKGTNGFTKSDIHLLETLATYISLALQQFGDDNKIGLRETLNTVNMHRDMNTSN